MLRSPDDEFMQVFCLERVELFSYEQLYSVVMILGGK